ncbi:MAG: flavodoxin family protein [archaeon]|nr:flavodoxin family protein [archaeon]
MKVLLVNGSPHREGCIFTDLSEIAHILNEEGVETETHWIGTGDVKGCRGCGSCTSTGRWDIKGDDIEELSARLDEFDGFVFGAPVYYSGPAGQMNSWMDRFFYSNGGRFDGKVAASVVNARRGGNSESFSRMNQYYLINNMVVPGSQYWNMTHGFTPEDVRKDKEGLQTMRMLAHNIAWILKCIDAGRKAGIEKPVREPLTPTHFIMPKE